jgi:hypothetical protein
MEAYNSMADLLADVANDETADTTNEQQKPVEEPETQTNETSEAGETEETGEPGESGEPEEKEGEPETQKKEDTPKHKSRANERIRELNEAKKQAESKAAQLEDRIRAIEARSAEIDKLADGEMPDASKFETLQDYVNALAEAKVKAALKLNQQEQLKNERETAAKAYEQEIGSSFEQKVQIAAQANPDLPKAVEHLNKLAQHIPIEVRHALITDENAAQLAWDIATNQELLDYVMMQNPINSIKVLAKLSAKYDPVEDTPSKAAPAAVAGNKPVAFTPSAKQAPKLPNVPKSGASGNKNWDNMSPSQYWKAYRAGKVDKKPWED